MKEKEEIRFYPPPTPLKGIFKAFTVYSHEDEVCDDQLRHQALY